MLLAHTSMKVSSSELDDQILNGSGSSSNEVNGAVPDDLTDPSATQPSSCRNIRADFWRSRASGVDGLVCDRVGTHSTCWWAWTRTGWRAATLRGAATPPCRLRSYLGPEVGAGFATNNKMPAKVSHIQQGILCRKGQPGQRLAVAPTWGSLEVDDIFSDAKKGIRNFTVSVLIGDVIVEQPSALRSGCVPRLAS